MVSCGILQFFLQLLVVAEFEKVTKKSDKKFLQKTVGFRHQMQTNKKLIVTTTNTTTILV